MSMSFKKTAMAAGMFTALAGASMSANAMREGEPGEANLVPFVLWSSCAVPERNIDDCLGINTVIKITVPMSVGNDIIPNFYTAAHSSPTNGTIDRPGPEWPANPAVVPSNRIRWYFLDRRSVHQLNGAIQVTPDDVAVIDWGAFLRKHGVSRRFDDFPGYMVLVTEAGSRGLDADFSFFAEAYMFHGERAGGGVLGVTDTKIPVMPMNDGADVGTRPTLENSVIETGVNMNVIASPLAAGIRTNWSDGRLGDVAVVDLSLGNRSVPIGDMVSPLQIPTLLVVWNDRNAGARWTGLGVEIFNDKEEKCSDTISLPDQLNLVWVQTSVTAGHANIPAWPVPRFITRFGTDRVFCVPPYMETPVTDPFGAIAFENLLQGGFMKLYLPEPIDSGIRRPESAAVAWSVPMRYHVTLETNLETGEWVFTDESMIPFETALGHPRGMFTPR